jgi:ankyrin repeat protein
VQLLLDAGADTNAVNAARRTPICRAASSGRAQVVQLLLDAPKLTVEAMATAARAAATAGHAELAVVVLRALMA